MILDPCFVNYVVVTQHPIYNMPLLVELEQKYTYQTKQANNKQIVKLLRNFIVLMCFKAPKCCILISISYHVKIEM